MKKPAPSVKVVRKMLEAWAGSRPRARKTSGMEPPAIEPSSMSQRMAPPITMPTFSFLVNHQAPQKESRAMTSPVARPI